MKIIIMTFAMSALFMILLRILQRQRVCGSQGKRKPRRQLFYILRNRRKSVVYEYGYGTKNNLTARRQQER